MDIPLAEIISIASLGLNLLIALVAGTWGIRKINDNLRNTFQTELDLHKDRTAQALNTLQASVSDQELILERNVGEMGTSLRTKIGEVELYMRDNFVKRDIFADMVKMMSGHIKTQFDQLHDSVNRLSDKIDKLAED